MLKYIGKRLLASVLTIWVIISLTFFLMRLMPGGPFDGEKITPEIRANLEVKYGLDQSLGNQYVLYMKNLVHGDLGTSMIFKGRDVADTIAYSFPASAEIGLIAVLCSLIIGVLLGVVAALNRGRWPDSLCMIIATLGITIPSFVVAALLIYVFTAKLKLLPATGFNSWKNCIMPVVALAGSSMAFITRLTRSRLLDVLKADYIRTARAKGLSNKVVIFKHALKNSLIPIVTYLGPLVAGVLTGSFVVEKIFAIPGLGNEFIQSVTNRDYSMLLGVTVFYCTLVIVCNFLVDIMYGFIDPRIKLENS